VYSNKSALETIRKDPAPEAEQVLGEISGKRLTRISLLATLLMDKTKRHFTLESPTITEVFYW
jgi:hypothetical protein